MVEIPLKFQDRMVIRIITKMECFIASETSHPSKISQKFIYNFLRYPVNGQSKNMEKTLGGDANTARWL